LNLIQICIGQDGEESGRLSRSSVGSSGSGGGVATSSIRPAQPMPGERRLVLSQEDRELMDLFRSQGRQGLIESLSDVTGRLWQ